MTPSHFVIFLKGDFLLISSGVEIIIGYFCFTEFGVLELSLLFLFQRFQVLELSRDDFTEFGVLEFFWNSQNPLFL